MSFGFPNDQNKADCLPMERGKSLIESLSQSSTAATFDRAIGQLPAKTLDQLLFDAIATVSQQALRKWRQTYAKFHPEATVEQMLEAVSAASLPTMKKRKIRITKSSIGSDFEARIDKKRQTVAFCNELNKIETDVPRGRECQICFERFAPEHTLHCLANEEHTVCRKCLVEYCRCNLHTSANFVCPMCKTGYDCCVLEVNLPVDLLEQINTKQIELDRRVALSSGVEAVLYCECGIVAVIEESEVGDSVVTCACSKAYCLRCGNFAHSGLLCPAPRETIKWLDKHGKLCPNCGEGIEKNGGCKHMTCRSCRYQFCWQCLGKWPRCACTRRQ